MKKIDVAAIQPRVGSGYPAPFHEPCIARRRVALGDAAKLTQFGVNRLTLEPGAWSSQRHYHTAEDEFVYVVEGEVVLVTDAGEETLAAGDSAGFPAGVADGHHLVNRSSRPAVVLEIGTRAPEGTDAVDYPDIDLVLPTHASGYQHRDGRPYPKRP
ncbi:MAG TPA: cupin domain-containing protein [Minicystis sp.]|nr:cupin domain-containing protein [Minicystis sp.]